MPAFPLEVLRTIFREACSVPEAFEYHYVDPEIHEAQVSQLIQDSMMTKLSLSLVSKLFHELANEYLYEIIQIRSSHLVRPLVNLLRIECGTNAVTRGWWCRRLEVDLCVRGEWSWGSITLWGLITTCPRLIDLRFAVMSGFVIRGPARTFSVSIPLAKILASRFGSSLRHLQLGKNVIISVPLAVKMLSHMTGLEVCRISTLEPIMDMELEMGISLPDETKVLEPEEDFGPPRVPRWCPDDKENEEYLDSAQRARWPSAVTQTIELPHLRDLRISPILSLVDDWRLPSLEAVTDTFCGFDWPDHDHLFALQKGLQSHSQFLRQITFDGTSIRGIWEVVGQLPFLQHLRFTTMYGFHGTLLTEPHPRLSTITVFRGPPFFYAFDDALNNVFLHVKEQKLPKLTQIKLCGDAEEDVVVERRRAICELNQLTLEIRNIDWME